MLLAGYAISYIGYGDDNVHANAIGIVFFVVVANLLVELAYVAKRSIVRRSDWLYWTSNNYLVWNEYVGAIGLANSVADFYSSSRIDL